MQTIKFKQSRDWGYNKPINWLIKNAKFSFNHTGRNGFRPHIVLDKELDKCNVFELEIERHGFVIKGQSEFWKSDYENMTNYWDRESISKQLSEYCNNNPEYVNPRFFKLKCLWEKWMSTRLVYQTQYYLRRGFYFYKNRERSWNWLSLQLTQGAPRAFYWSFSTNPPYKQWFANFSIFPLFFNKDNGSWEFGLNMIWISLKLKYQF